MFINRTGGTVLWSCRMDQQWQEDIGRVKRIEQGGGQWDIIIEHADLSDGGIQEDDCVYLERMYPDT